MHALHIYTKCQGFCTLVLFITGSSTHIERIERLWRDVFRCVGKLFYEVYHLEVEEALDPLNETDIFYMFVPFINMCLNEQLENKILRNLS